jgi:LCP family protein required for cell wall assembly
MIHPQNVDEPRSPYSSAKGFTSRPVAMNFVPTPTPQPPEKKKWFTRRKKEEVLLTPEQKKRRRIKRIAGTTIFTMLIAGSAFVFIQYRNFRNNVLATHEGSSSNVLDHDLSSGSLDTSLYTTPGDGRFNLVILGVGGSDHPGSDLTDTIQVLSIDKINKKMTTTSVPRDLYVTLPTGGKSKINAAFDAGESRKTGEGGLAVREAVGNVLGITITNYVYIDFAGAKDIVNSLGGIDVNVPTAINDPFFPCDDTIRYCPFYIKAGLHHMDGTTALQYSRSRETTSDFDRSARQQIVMQAMKAKALSAGVLTNPIKVNNLLNAISKHFKTDLSTSDISSLITLYGSIASADSSAYVLDTSSALGLLTDSSGTYAGYIEYPVLGEGKYDAIHSWFQKNSPDPLLTREAPTVTLLNGGATSKQMTALQQRLTDYGYVVSVSPTTLNKKYVSTQVFAKDNSKPISSNYLKSILGVASQTGLLANSATDFEIVVTSSTINLNVTPSPTPKPSPKPTASPSPDPTDSPTPAPSDSPSPTP